MSRYDAVLLVSFGGPRGPEDVQPFLRNVTAGRNVPDHRLAVVAEQYLHFGGVSPINAQNEQLRRALEVELAQRGPESAIPVYLGNRNWDPYLADVVAEIIGAGARRVAVVVTSGYSSYSGCRQYREDLYAALEGHSHSAQVQIDKVGRWFDQPEFVEVMTDNVEAALGGLDAPLDRVHVLYTTHSLPVSMSASSGDPALGGDAYVHQHEFVVDSVQQRLRSRGVDLPSELVFQSRSGPAHVPWLEPDVGDRIRQLASTSCEAVVVVPIGFMSDHMEVRWDLDTQAAQIAQDHALEFARAATVGTDPRFVRALVRQINEREQQVPLERRVSLSPTGPAPDLCPIDCCLPPAGARRALCGQE